MIGPDRTDWQVRCAFNAFKYTSIRIIRQAKQTMVQKGYPFYNNKRLGHVPKMTVESILGCELELEEDSHG